MTETRCDIFVERSREDWRFFQLLLAIRSNVTPVETRGNTTQTRYLILNKFTVRMNSLNVFFPSPTLF